MHPALGADSADRVFSVAMMDLYRKNCRGVGEEMHYFNLAAEKSRIFARKLKCVKWARVPLVKCYWFYLQT